MTPQRFKNYTLYRERDHTDIPWHRPADFKSMSLKAPVVLINGAFDILHSTHMRLIYAARHKAGTLICALDSDDKIATMKGPERPIMTYIERATALNYMPIDMICEITCKRDMTTLVNNLRPDIHVQGDEYRDISDGYKHKRVLIREGKIHTGEIIRRIVEKYEKTKEII